MQEVEISYQTIVEKPREGMFGAILRWIAAHPLWAGLIGGLLAVGIAALRAPGGLEAAPTTAAILSGIVVVVWVVLFRFLRNFFARQAVVQVDVRRDILVADDQLIWQQDGEPLRTVREPVYQLLTTSVPAHVLDENPDQPWPVWLVARGREEQFVIETKITAGEAARYRRIEPDTLEAVDELLPTALASPLLGCADRRLED